VGIDLQDLKASLTRPMGQPNAGQYWLDVASTSWGINEWNIVTSQFTVKNPSVILDSTRLEDITTTYNGVSSVTEGPSPSFGDIGNYSVNALALDMPIFFKCGGPSATQTTAPELSNIFNTWVQVGSDEWALSWPTVTGTLAPTAVPVGSLEINGVVVNIAGLGTTVAQLADDINAAAIPGVFAAAINGKLMLYSNMLAVTASIEGGVDFGPATTAGVLSALGILPTPGGVTNSQYLCPRYQASRSYQVPRWRTTDTAPHPTGSIWLKTNNVNQGANIVVKKYDAVLDTFVRQTVSIYRSDLDAINSIDPAGGGAAIPAGTLYAEVNPLFAPTGPDIANNADYGMAGFTLYSRFATGPTVVAAAFDSGTFVAGSQFILQASEPNDPEYTEVTVTLSGTTAQNFVADISSAAVSNVSAYVNNAGRIVIAHATGGIVNLVPIGTLSTSPIVVAGFVNSAWTSVARGAKFLYVEGEKVGVTLSNWVGSPLFTYIPLATAPDQDPNDGTLWYYSAFDQVDIMIQNNGRWMGYQNVTNDVRGYNLTLTNPNGPIFNVTPPTSQFDAGNTPLQFGDLWVDTSDLINYPKISRWSNVSGEGQWVLLDNADNTTENGILYADARWSSTGAVDPVVAELPTIESLLISDYVDPDAPNPLLYPQGTLLFNTRRSGFNVKSFQVNYFNATDYPVAAWNPDFQYPKGTRVSYEGTLYVCVNTGPISATQGVIPGSTGSSTIWQLLQTNAWVTASQNNDNGTPNMGRNAQRIVIVTALKSGIDNSAQARQEQLNYTLLACTQYPELTPNLVALNIDRGNSGFVIGDTPLRLAPSDIQAWINDDAAPYLDKNPIVQLGDQYTGIFYPSCQTRDLSGLTVVTAPSHMMIRTIIRSDQLSWPWFAPAGVRRGLVENAIRIGYLKGNGQFVSFSNDLATRDLLYTNNINPITFQAGVGILNFGNKTCTNIRSALDRINVARLIGYIRMQLERLSQQFLFEPNDQLTRDQFRNAVTSLMLDLQTKRGIYDYLVICDLSNNTPQTIDRNELWLDLAIEPLKAVEFIYIPIRILNTGEIASLSVGA
jgi:hypothetical protein